MDTLQDFRRAIVADGPEIVPCPRRVAVDVGHRKVDVERHDLVRDFNPRRQKGIGQRSARERISSERSNGVRYANDGVWHIKKILNRRATDCRRLGNLGHEVSNAAEGPGY